MITEETVNILDDIEHLSDKILDSRLYHSFKKQNKIYKKTMKHIYSIKPF